MHSNSIEIKQAAQKILFCAACLLYFKIISRQKTNPNPLSYKTKFEFAGNGDPTGNRTRVTAVKGRCLDRLTIGP